MIEKRSDKNKDFRSWNEGEIVYQIYPRSFMDGNNDGVGDLIGAAEKLDHIKELGVHAVWLSPFYPSPMKDFGYDVSNYCDVDPIFGDLKDFDNFVDQAHKRKLKVMVDFVLNHTSDQHPWFLQSRSSKDNPKRDWYTWADPKLGGKEPNNWRANFGGRAWTLDDTTGQYYLHSFLPEQPDLNWDNPEVRAAMKDVVQFWLNRGVDGFRLDVPEGISKYGIENDEPVRPKKERYTESEYDKLKHTFSKRGPKFFDYLNEVGQAGAKINSKAFFIAEVYPDADDKVGSYLEFYRKLDSSLIAPFYFECIKYSWSAKEFKQAIDEFQARAETGDTPYYAFSNHDTSRIVSRIGEQPARAAAVMLLTLPGIPFIYNGDELGLEDGAIKPTQVKDPAELRQPNKGLGRDPERTPMVWDSSQYGGFSEVEPWLPLTKSRHHKNVENEKLDPDSFLNLYKKLIKLRNENELLKKGDYISMDAEDPNIFMFGRKLGDEQLVTAINFSGITSAKLNIDGEILLTTSKKVAAANTLQPLEARIVKL